MPFVPPVGMALVEWTDHALHTGEWDGDEALPVMSYRSLGWLLPPRGDGIVRLAQSWARSQQYSDFLALDPRVVDSITLLRKGRPRGSAESGGQVQP